MAGTHERAGYSIRLGCFCRLVCDNLWAWRVVRPSKQEYAALGDPPV